MKDYNEKNSESFVVYKKWFFIAFIVALANFVNAVLWCSFQSITPSTAVYYQTSTFGVNFLSTIFIILYILVAPLSSWLIDNHGFSKAIILGAVLNLMGSMVRLVTDFLPVEYRFIICFLGQTIAAIGQPFILNCNILD